MNNLIFILGPVALLTIWILIEVKGSLWLRIITVLVASFTIWEASHIATSIMPSKERGMNTNSFSQIERMIDEGRKNEAFELLEAYVKEYQENQYDAAKNLAGSTLQNP